MTESVQSCRVPGVRVGGPIVASDRSLVEVGEMAVDGSLKFTNLIEVVIRSVLVWKVVKFGKVKQEEEEE